MKFEEAVKVISEPTREDFEKAFGQVWDTTELQEDYHVKSFLAPLVIVERKSDGQRGTLDFTHRPRFYYNFRANS